MIFRRYAIGMLAIIFGDFVFAFTSGFVLYCIYDGSVLEFNVITMAILIFFLIFIILINIYYFSISFDIILIFDDRLEMRCFKKIKRTIYFKDIKLIKCSPNNAFQGWIFISLDRDIKLDFLTRDLMFYNKKSISLKYDEKFVKALKTKLIAAGIDIKKYQILNIKN